MDTKKTPRPKLVQIRSWLQKERRSHRWLAEQIGVGTSAVNQWVSGWGYCTPENALEVERVTGLNAGGLNQTIKRARRGYVKREELERAVRLASGASPDDAIVVDLSSEVGS